MQRRAICITVLGVMVQSRTQHLANMAILILQRLHLHIVWSQDHQRGRGAEPPVHRRYHWRGSGRVWRSSFSVRRQLFSAVSAVAKAGGLSVRRLRVQKPSMRQHDADCNVMRAVQPYSLAWTVHRTSSTPDL